MKDMRSKIAIWIVLVVSIAGSLFWRRLDCGVLYNITYSCGEDVQSESVERIVVEEIKGSPTISFNGFEYNDDRNRYELWLEKNPELSDAYLNLWVKPFDRTSFKLSPRLTEQDAIVSDSDLIIVTAQTGTGFILSREMIKVSQIDGSVTLTPEKKELIYNYIFLMLVLAATLGYLIFILFDSKRIGIAISIVLSSFCICYILFGYLVKHAIICSCVCTACLFVCICIQSVRNLLNGKILFIKDVSLDVLVPSLFFIFTCIIYLPSSLVIGNIRDFQLNYFSVVFPLIISVVLLCLVFLFVIGSSFKSQRIRRGIGYFIFLFSIIVYAQINFLNPQLPALDGQTVDWDSFRLYELRSIFFCLITALVFVLMCLWKKSKQMMNTLVLFISIALCMMQLSALVVMALGTDFDAIKPEAISKDGEWELGEKENTIIFLVDTLQADTLDSYLDYPESSGILDGFTIYNNVTVSAGPTRYSIPSMFTGQYYSPVIDIDDFYEEAWDGATIFKDIKGSGADLRIFAPNSVFCTKLCEYAENIVESEGNYISDKCGFLSQIYKLSAFVGSPMQLKKYFYLYTDDITQYIVAHGVDCELYSDNNIEIYSDYSNNHLHLGNYEKAFRYYHMYGVHAPYINGDYMSSNITDEVDCLRGIMRFIGQYIQEMKELGIYDKSTIIIMGDHGRHRDKYLSMGQAGLAIKYPNEKEGNTIVDLPITSRNILATVARPYAVDKNVYGPTIQELDWDSYIYRYCTVQSGDAEDIELPQERTFDTKYGQRFIVEKETDDNGHLVFAEWNPFYINRIEYFVGDAISFANSDFTGVRHIDSSETTYLSDEFNITLDMTGSVDKLQPMDMDIYITDIIGNEQNMVVYVNGHSLGKTKICDTGMLSLHIPKEYFIIPDYITVDDNVKERTLLTIEFMFPNACTLNMVDKANEDKKVLSVGVDKLILRL